MFSLNGQSSIVNLRVITLIAFVQVFIYLEYHALLP